MKLWSYIKKRKSEDMIMGELLECLSKIKYWVCWKIYRLRA